MNKVVQLPWLNIQIVITKGNTSNLHNIQLLIINQKHLIIFKCILSFFWYTPNSYRTYFYTHNFHLNQFSLGTFSFIIIFFIINELYSITLSKLTV